MRDRTVVLEEIAAVAKTVRTKQCAYFRTKATGLLFESKTAERQLDGLLAELDAATPAAGA